MAASSPRPQIPFAESKRSQEFGHALLQKMLKRLNDLREQYISPQNVCNFPHGHGWTFQQQREEGYCPEAGVFEKQSTEVSYAKERILSNDLTLVEEFIFNMASRMHKQFTSQLFKEVDQTCDRFGRTTNVGKNESLVDGLLAGLADVQLGVDADGNVSSPRMFLSEEFIEKLKLEMLTRGDSAREKAAEIRAEAERKAREREAERLAKFERK
jgi:hypothetical protein